ncbi:Late embryogenesis abundant protein [Sesbania bispinosa]|nr:Late embryogenesis abundant protein [Sesbania bispinosa]
MTSDAYHKRYVALEGQYGPPPHAHYAPHRHKAHRGSSGCGCGCGLCLRCCCCCFGCFRCCICIILIFIFLLVAIALALYYFLKPNIPSYNVESLDVKAFDIRDDNKIYSDIVVVVKAENPNEGIGLEYLDNKVNIMYSGSTLCSGHFPPFMQPQKNTTKVNVELKGESDFGTEMQDHLMKDQDAGKIPLLITVKVPIRIVIDDMIHLRRFVVKVNCSLVIDQLQPNKKPQILKKDFTYGVDF